MRQLVVPFSISRNHISQEIHTAHVRSLFNNKEFGFFKTTDEIQEVIDSSSQDEELYLEFYISSLDDYRKIAELWGKVNKDSRKVVFSIQLATKKDNAINSLVVDLGCEDFFDYQNRLEVAINDLKEKFILLISESAPLLWNFEKGSVLLTSDLHFAMSCCFEFCKIKSLFKVLFLENEVVNKFATIPRGFWKNIFASSLVDVKEINRSLQLGTFTMANTTNPEVVFVFPERMLPLRRAFFARGFDLLLGLSYSGQPLGTIVYGPNNKDLDRIRIILEIFCCKAWVFPLKKEVGPLYQRLIFQFEIYLRLRHGFDHKPPLRFTERMHMFCGPKSMNFMSSVLFSPEASNVKTVVYTGAWFGKCIEKVKKKRRGIKWICDTHDVFFVLDKDSNSSEIRYFYSAKHEKKKELSLLKQADCIIAISSSDSDSLNHENINKPILVQSGSFSHISYKRNVKIVDSALQFGFVGTNNNNNRKCLSIILNSWLPIILKYHPSAILNIAGAIESSDEAKELLRKFPDNVKCLGFVDDISEFYRSMFAILSPIAVQGGLNFKSVEALMAGRPVITNPLGSKCLGGEGFGVFVVSEAEKDLFKVLGSIESRNYQDMCEEIRVHAEGRYGDDVAYQNLINFIKS